MVGDGDWGGGLVRHVGSPPPPGTFHPRAHPHGRQTVPLKGAERLSGPALSDYDAPGGPDDRQQDLCVVATADNSLWVLDFVPFAEQVPTSGLKASRLL